MRAARLLAIGTFALGTDSYITAGLLVPVARDFSVPLGAAGQLVTAFTLSYALAAPSLAVVLARHPARRLLVVALALFTVANVLAAVAPTFGVLLLSRVLAGIAAGVFSPMAATTAAALVPPQRRGRALSVVLVGLSAGSAVGVPLGLLCAGQWGWRSALWSVTGVSLLALIAVAAGLPRVPAQAVPSVRVRLSVLRRPAVLAVVGVTMLQTVASLGTYTYLAPVLATAGGIDDPTWHLWAWGLGGVAASLGVGAVLDRYGRPTRASTMLLVLLALALAALPVTVAHPPASIAVVLAWGAVGWAFVVPQQQRLIQGQGGAGPVAVGLNSSATYLGGAVGAALGGVALSRNIPVEALPWLAAAFAAGGGLLQLAAGVATHRPDTPGSRTEASVVRSD